MSIQLPATDTFQGHSWERENGVLPLLQLTGGSVALEFPEDQVVQKGKRDGSTPISTEDSPLEPSALPIGRVGKNEDKFRSHFVASPQQKGRQATYVILQETQSSGKGRRN